MRFFEHIQVAAGHGNDFDTALAYGAPPAGARGISGFHPIVKIISSDKYNSPRVDSGVMGMECAYAMF